MSPYEEEIVDSTVLTMENWVTITYMRYSSLAVMRKDHHNTAGLKMIFLLKFPF